MEPNQTKAFDFALENIKQLLTLSTGFLALTITFRKDIASSPPHGASGWLEAGWVAFLASVVFGVLCIGSLTGSLGRGEQPTVYRCATQVLAGLQSLAFVVALGLVVMFALKVL